MLPKKYRLRKKSDFFRLKNEGEVYESPFFNLLFLKYDSSENSCFGFIISKKVSLLAVKRNQLKRLFSLKISDNLSLVNPGYKVLLILKKSSLANPESAVSLLSKGLVEIGVIKSG